jgi:hypothetical protein
VLRRDGSSADEAQPSPSANHGWHRFLACGGLASGGGLAVVGDLLAGVRSFGRGGMAHFPDGSGVVSGHFSDEGVQGVVAA